MVHYLTKEEFGDGTGVIISDRSKSGSLIDMAKWSMGGREHDMSYRAQRRGDTSCIWFKVFRSQRYRWHLEYSLERYLWRGWGSLRGRRGPSPWQLEYSLERSLWRKKQSKMWAFEPTLFFFFKNVRIRGLGEFGSRALYDVFVTSDSVGRRCGSENPSSKAFESVVYYIAR